MKVWKFYKNLTEEEYEAVQGTDLSLEDKYPLYAFTNKKEYRDMFKSMRKKSRFIEMEAEMTKEEWIDFANNNRINMLDMYSFKEYKKKRKGREPQFKDVQVLSTWAEKETTNACLESLCTPDISNGGSMQYPINILVFKDEYIKALMVLGYIDYWKMYYESDVPEEELLKDLASIGIDIDYSAPNVIYNEFTGFLNLYGDTFKDN